MERIKKIMTIMLKAMGVQAVISFIISLGWIFLEIRKGTESIGIEGIAFAFLNAFFLLGLLSATIAIIKMWWDFFWLKRELSKDIKAHVALEGNDAPVPEIHDYDSIKESRIILTREKTWEIALIILGVVDFAISYALSVALISFK